MLAPTGTIGFMMDCDTTGIEPDIALVKYKKLVGGGVIKIVNQSVPGVLAKLGYTAAEIQDILKYIDEKEMIEGAPHMQARSTSPVFDCAFPPANGKRSIHYMGHIKMMAAVQPFLSGAISKTVNMPTDATPEEIANAYLESWRLGPEGGGGLPRRLQAQPAPLHEPEERRQRRQAAGRGRRRSRRGASCPTSGTRSPTSSRSPGHEGYITVGMYEDGKPGEIFLVMAKEGSTISGLMDAFATSISMALQYGVPLEALVEKFCHVRFEPSGFTKNPEIPYAKSITDYIFRWLASKFLSRRAPGGGGGAAAAKARSSPCSAPVAVTVDRALPAATAGLVGGQLPRPDRRAALPLLRQHHDPQRLLLPLRELRQHERLQLVARSTHEGFGVCRGPRFSRLEMH